MKTCSYCNSASLKITHHLPTGIEIYNCTSCDSLSNYCNEIEVDDHTEEEDYQQPFKGIVSTVAMTVGDIKGLNLPDDYEIVFDGFYGRSDKAEVRVDHKTKRISIN